MFSFSRVVICLLLRVSSKYFLGLSSGIDSEYFRLHVGPKFGDAKSFADGTFNYMLSLAVVTGLYGLVETSRRQLAPSLLSRWC